MSTKEKLLERLCSNPKDFTFDDAKTLLESFGYKMSHKGKTSGSRVAFRKSQFKTICMHKPHGRKELLSYQVQDLIDVLKQEGIL